MNVLISGAGIAGPTAAHFLSRIGATVTIVEKAPELLSHGQNIDVEGGGVTVIKKMGLLDELYRNNTTERGMRLLTSGGTTIASFPRHEDSPSITGTSMYEVLRGDLAKLLYEATKTLPGVTYRFGTTITKVISNDEKAVTVQLSSGETASYDLLIVCDGQWSKTRAMVFDKEEVSTRDLGMFAVYWTVPRQPKVDTRFWDIFISDQGRIVSTRPDSHGTTRAFMSIIPRDEKAKQQWGQSSRSGDRQSQEELLKRTFADAGWASTRLLDNVSDADDFYVQSLQQIKMSKWSQGRVVCTGDAAYCPTAVSGSGTMVALVGAYQLAGELGALQPGEHPARALDAYEKGVRPLIEHAQGVPDWGPRLFHANTWWMRLFVQGLIAALSITCRIILAIPPLAQRFGQTDPELNDDGFKLPEYAVFQDK